MFPIAGKCFSFKLVLLNFNNVFQQQKKALNVFSLDGKVTFGGSNIWTNEREWFSLARKLVYKSFHKQLVSTIHSNDCHA